MARSKITDFGDSRSAGADGGLPTPPGQIWARSRGIRKNPVTAYRSLERSLAI
jgi:hypothetical protein